jgi:hypothetical protein
MRGAGRKKHSLSHTIVAHSQNAPGPASQQQQTVDEEEVDWENEEPGYTNRGDRESKLSPAATTIAAAC